MQEPYMEGVNPFIKNNKHRMIMFLDELGVSHIYCIIIRSCGFTRVIMHVECRDDHALQSGCVSTCRFLPTGQSINGFFFILLLKAQICH